MAGLAGAARGHGGRRRGVAPVRAQDAAPSGRTPRCGRTRQGAGAGGGRHGEAMAGAGRAGRGQWRGARGEERWARGRSGRTGRVRSGKSAVLRAPEQGAVATARPWPERGALAVVGGEAPAGRSAGQGAAAADGACALRRERGATGKEATGRGGHGAGAVHGGVAAGTRPRGRLRGEGRVELREHAGERVPSRTTPAWGQRGR
nr:spidroin-1-like [Aegilops tauschii subsp. strangulata]